MGRPRKPSTATIRRLYYRLLEGPFWVGDWRSTGIGSYGTVNTAIQFLYDKGLLKRRREGHKILYELIPKDIFESDITEWWPLLTTKREREDMEKDDAHARETWVKRFVDRIRPGIRVIGRLGTLSHDDARLIEMGLSNEEIIRFIEEADNDLKPWEVYSKWYEVCDFQLCPNCLSERRELVRTVTDQDLGEIACPNCGLVIIRDEVERIRDTRPSPFPPPR